MTHYRVRILTLTVVAIVTLAVAAAADVGHKGHPLEQIERAYQQGDLTLDERVILQIQAIKYPEKLPAEYRPGALQSSVDAHHGCATMALVDIRRVFDQLEPKTQDYVQAAMARASAQFTYISPSGFFKLHYDLTGTDAVSGTDLDVSGVPDYVEQVAAYLDTSLVHHQALGYLMPPPDGGLGGDNLFDVYFENMGFYGYAQPEGPGPEPWNDYYSYLVMHHTFVGFPPNTDPEGNIAGAAKATAAHEFHHCVQFAYDVFEPSWYMELDATNTEDLVFDLVNDNYNYLPSFMSAPETSLMDQSIHMYASFIFGMYLTEKFDTSVTVAAWDGARFGNLFEELDDTLQVRYGWTLDSAFAEFTAWNYATGSRDDGLHYSEGASYPLIEVNATHSVYPVSLRNSPVNPAGYAACYVTFLPGSAQGSLRLTFNGTDSRQWAAWVVKSTATNVHTFERIPLEAGSYFGEFDVPNFHTYDRVTLIGVNLTESSGAAAYAYKASVVIPHAVSTQLLTVDTVVYSGGTREYDLLIANESDFSDIIDVTVTDDLGWVNFGPVGYALPAQSDSVVTISINPPQGTPLNETANVNFAAQSRDDALAADTASVNVTTVLNRGDVDFSGVFDPIDLAYFVDYFFAGGTQPQPVQMSGDVNCDDAVDPIDMAFMTDYFFLFGLSVQCNPY